MRDPAASLHFEATTVVRRLHQPIENGNWLRSELAQSWIKRGDLVDFQLSDESTVVADRLPFVTHPSEWCDSQLYEAAKLTLKLQEEAVISGFDMKDASAWNVIFDGSRPVFCDLLSFEVLSERKWWAAGQFARHFILPLLLSRRRGLHAHQSFLGWRDGVPHELARTLLGPSRFLTRYWPLVAAGKSVPVAAGSSVSEPGSRDLDVVRRFRVGLQSSLRWMLSGVDPARIRDRQTVWRDYTANRAHYGGDDLQVKRVVLNEWLSLMSASWVLDLGCNSGEFSEIALAHGANVIAADADHGAIERLYEKKLERLHPLVVNLDDLQGGRGWAGLEHTGLPDRLNQRVDAVLMLALIHHLTIGASIPLAAIGRFADACTKRWCIVEILHEDDPQLKALCAQRRRDSSDFTPQLQRLAFQEAGFEVRREISLPSGYRTLVMFEKRV